MSAAAATFDALNTLYLADTGAGGLNLLNSAAQIKVFARNESPQASPNTPYCWVEIQEDERDPFGGSAGKVAVMVRVTFHLYSRRDPLFAVQDAVLARMRTVFKGKDWGTSGSWTLGIGCRKRGFAAAPSDTLMHYIEQYTTIASFN